MVPIHLDEVLVPHDFWGSSKDLRDVWDIWPSWVAVENTGSNLWCLLMPLHLIKTFNHPWQIGRDLVVNFNQKVDLVKTHPTVSLSIRIFTKRNGIQVKVNSDSIYFPIISESIIIHHNPIQGFSIIVLITCLMKVDFSCMTGSKKVVEEFHINEWEFHLPKSRSKENYLQLPPGGWTQMGPLVLVGM